MKDHRRRFCLIALICMVSVALGCRNNRFGTTAITGTVDSVTTSGPKRFGKTRRLAQRPGRISSSVDSIPVDETVDLGQDASIADFQATNFAEPFDAEPFDSETAIDSQTPHTEAGVPVNYSDESRTIVEETDEALGDLFDEDFEDPFDSDSAFFEQAEDPFVSPSDVETVIQASSTELTPVPPPAPEGQEGEFDQTLGSMPNQYPIDLPTVLRLAGTDNWGVRLAAERVNEAYATWQAARVMWIPSLNAGIGYTKHEGQIQATPGQVIDVSRNSLFVGGGAGVNNAPLTGGAGGPARLFVDLSLADAIFEPLAAKQLVCAEQARQSATFNDTAMAASLAYYDLVGAQAQLAIARANDVNAGEVLDLTESFVAAGKGSQADIARANVVKNTREQSILTAEMNIRVASAELARILQLDPSKMDPNSVLFPLEEQPLPVELVDTNVDLSILIDHGRNARPEVHETHSRMRASQERYLAEKWRPFIPNLYLGASAGGFGGGVNDNLNQLDGRADFDALAVWQVRNLGFGVQAAQDQRGSQFRQAIIDDYRIRDVVAMEVMQAFYQVQTRHEQIELARQNIEQAVESYDQNIARIRALEGLPLEAVQAVDAIVEAREGYLAAVIAYNQAQVRLLRAIGRPFS